MSNFRSSAGQPHDHLTRLAEAVTDKLAGDHRFDGLDIVVIVGDRVACRSGVGAELRGPDSTGTFESDTTITTYLLAQSLAQMTRNLPQSVSDGTWEFIRKRGTQ